MNIELARTMVRIAFDANRTLQTILPALKAGLPEADYRASAHDLVVAVDHVNTALLARHRRPPRPRSRDRDCHPGAGALLNRRYAGQIVARRGVRY
jgi:hypothetical protein